MKRKILIVEDDIDLNETIREFLENFYNVDSVKDGEEALNKAYEKNYDVIILDVKLPKIDGFSVAKEIRKFSKTPIIFLTSLDSEKDVEKGFLSGGDDYIKGLIQGANHEKWSGKNRFLKDFWKITIFIRIPNYIKILKRTKKKRRGILFFIRERKEF